MSGGDAEYDLLFTVEFPAVMRTVYLIIHELDHAEDITQDAFIQLLRHWAKVSRYDRPGAWVRRVAIRLAMDSLRRERLRTALERQVAGPTVLEASEIDILPAIPHCRGCSEQSSCSSTSRIDRLPRSPTSSGAPSRPLVSICTGRGSTLRKRSERR